MRIAVFLLAFCGFFLASALAAAETPGLELPPSLLQTLDKAKVEVKTPYDIKQWIATVQKGDHVAAAHLWATVAKQMPKKMKDDATAVYLVQLSKLGLEQTFVDELLKQLARPSFLKSAAWKALAPSAGSYVGGVLMQNAIFFSDDQKATIKKLPAKEPGSIELKAWADLRNGKALEKTLKMLPADHPMRPYFVPNVVFDLAKANKIQEARTVLETELKAPDLAPEARASYELLLGRLHFQMADLEQAEKHYSAVSPESYFVNEAREELLWVWLRLGDHQKLRGGITSMQLGRYESSFVPELFTIRAISNLKLCYFDAAHTDFVNFTKYNQTWAERIDRALKEAKPERPGTVDMFTGLLETAEKKRRDEAAAIAELHEQSVKAAAPAVGEQRHWADAKKSLTQRANRLEQAKLAEYKRIWRNHAVMLREAIRKMRFVKVELLSQLQNGATPKPDSESSKKAAEEAMAKLDKESEGRMVFPFDGVAWPDEVFAARSTAGNVCL